MKALTNLKEKLSRILLQKRVSSGRRTQGFDFNRAEKVSILFVDADEGKYKLIKQFARELKSEFGIRQVKGIAFINSAEKEVPIYHAHKLEMDYFTREDLSWNLQASQNLKLLRDESCDILIDVSEINSLHLDYFLKYSSAKMKVGRAGTPREKEYDLIINTPENYNTKVFLDQVKEILGNLKIQ